MIGKLWRGEIRLSITFWVFHILIPAPVRLFLRALASDMERSGIFDESSLDPDAGLALIVYFSLFLILLLYSLFTSVAVWRSANGYDGQKSLRNFLWGSLAKIFVICGWILFVVLTLGELLHGM